MIRLTLLFALLLIAAPSWATTYWVSTGGAGTLCTDVDGDADPGVYMSPVTFDALNCEGPGDTVKFKAGTYTMLINWNTLLRSGSSGSLISYICEGDRTCILRPTAINSSQLAIISVVEQQYVNIGLEGFGFDIDGVNVANPSTTIIMGFYAKSTTVSDRSQVNFRGNYIHNHNYNGFSYARSSTTTSFTGGIISGNLVGAHQTFYVSSEAFHAIYPQVKSYTITRNDLTVENNVSGIGSYGIHCYPGGVCTNNVIGYNLVRGSGTRGNGVLVAGSGNRIANNVVRNPSATSGTCIAFNSSSADNNSAFHNVCHGYLNRLNNSSGATGNEYRNNVCVTGFSCNDVLGAQSVAGTSQNVTGVATSEFVDQANYNYALVAGSSLIDHATCLAISGRAYNGVRPDCGAFETFSIASAEVGSIDATSLILTFNNNVFPPLLPSTGITGITVRENTTPVTVSSCARTGDNIVDCTLASSITTGTTVDWSYAQTGNLTDSALIGGTVSQELLAVTNSAVTNNVGGGAPTYVFSQAAYEFHGKYGTEAAPVIKPDGVASTGAAENFANMTVIPGGSIRVRFAVTCTTADCPPVGFIPRYSKNSGAYTVVPDAFAADNIGFCGTSTALPDNGAATTDQLSTSGAFLPGALVLTSNAIPTIHNGSNVFPQNNKTELEYCFTFDTDAASGDTYDFRLYNQDGSTITYTVTPRVTINAAAGGFGELWDLLMFAMLPIMGRIESQTAKPVSNLAVSYPNADQVVIEGLACTSLKTSGTGLKRTITCGH